MHFGVKAILLVIIIDIMFLIGGVSNIGGDLVNSMFNINVDDDSNYYVSGVTGELNESIPTGGSGGSFETGSNVLNFIDGLKTITSFLFGFMISIVLAPINIITGLGVSGIISLMIGIPLTIVYILGIVLIIRGLS